MNSPSVKPATFLIVDDDDADRMAMRRLVGKKGIQNPVVEAVDGATALELLRSGELTGDVVLFLDLKMPKVDGHELLDTIREDPTLARLSVVVTTGSDDPRDLERSAQLEVIAHLTKPLTASTFDEILARLESEHRVLIERA